MMEITYQTLQKMVGNGFVNKLLLIIKMLL